MDKKSIENLRKAVYEWLKKEGYPLEMKVAKELSSLGLGIRQGWYFTDPEEGKPREIDILAFFNVATGHPLMVQLVIECKRSRKPFVIFSYPDRTLRSPTPDIIQASPIGKRFIEKVIADGTFNQLPLFTSTSPRGYAMTQAHISVKDNDKTSGSGSKKDEAFDALMKVAKATHWLVDYYSREIVEKEGESGSYVVAYLAYPMIVIDAPLYDCYLNENNKLEVNPISRVSLTWSYPLLGNFPVTVCNIEALPKIADQALETWEYLANHEIHL